MRLLLLAPQYPPILGGAELQAQRLAHAFNAAGLRVTVLTQPYPGQDTEENSNGVRIVRRLSGLHLGPVWGITFMRSTARWLRRLGDQWDVLHNQQVGLHSWSSVRVANRLQKPSLLRLAAVGSGGDLEVMRQYRLGNWLISGLRDAGRFVALTPAGVTEIARFGLPTERTRVIPNGIDLSHFEVQPWPRLDPTEPLRLLFVGRLMPQKGVDVLLGAMGLLSDPGRFRLRIVGVGTDRDSLHAQALRAGLDGVVQFCGSRRAIASEYAWSEVVVLPSRFEGMPNVVLEAMACGRPVLGTRVAGTEDLIEEDCSGWLVPSESPRALAEALERIARMRDTLPCLGQRGRHIVEMRYSLGRVVSMYISEYEELLAELPAQH